MAKKTSQMVVRPDDFTKAFGEEFWDLPHEARFEMVLKACLNAPATDVSDEEEDKEETE